ncbi:hypothetical protein [Parafrankia elaeagni]|uniref:hypothetical protein n=1 Tax=Parafrankia elaeagni TaxID=222534 RepID=UPI000372F1E9|nr:hypothetical protein [Parafrankia elaeagni]
MTVVVAVVVLVVATATYLTWLAGRLDRLANRVDATRAGLVAQLTARADAARALARNCGLDDLAIAAERARAGHATLLAEGALDATAEDAENALSRALRSPAVARAVGGAAPGDVHAVDAAAARVALARQFHNDAVGDVRSLAGRRLVRLMHLSGRRPLPAYFEIDDAPPVREDGPPRPGSSAEVPGA